MTTNEMLKAALAGSMKPSPSNLEVIAIVDMVATILDRLVGRADIEAMREMVADLPEGMRNQGWVDKLNSAVVSLSMLSEAVEEVAS